MPLFFEKTKHRGASKKLFVFPLAVPPFDILPPKWVQISELFVILRDGGILRKRSNARGKVTKMSAMNSIILKKLSRVHIIACWGENRFSNLKSLKNHPYLTSFSLGGCSLWKLRSNKGDFWNFWDLKNDFLLNKQWYGPETIFSEYLSSLQTFWSPFPRRSTFFSKSPHLAK